MRCSPLPRGIHLLAQLPEAMLELLDQRPGGPRELVVLGLDRLAVPVGVDQSAYERAGYVAALAKARRTYGDPVTSRS